jgi:hypothetical protein
MPPLKTRLLVDPDDVSQEGKGFDLSSHEVDENLLVEVFVLPLLRRRLQRYGVHDQRNELGHLLHPML